MSDHDDLRRLEYEISTLRSDVGRLACTLREARAEADGLRARVEDLEARELAGRNP